MQIKIEKLSGSEVEIIGEITADDFELKREAALKEISEGVNIPGFRPGHIPEKILTEKIGEQAVLEKMAEMCLQKAYPVIIEENKIEAVGRPEITITKIAANNPLGFKIKTAVLPEMELPDYKNIATQTMKKKEEVSVEDKEVEQTIEYLRKSRAHKDEQEKEILPELNDDFVKGLGQFKDVEDFKKKIKENILMDKKIKMKEKKRLEILDKVIASMKIEVPGILIEAEKNKILSETKANISQMGMKWDDYLKHVKKTEEEMLAGWENDAVKRIKHGLVLNKMAEAEKIEVPEADIDRETEKIVEHYKNGGQDVDRNRVREYTYNMLKNEKLFQLLEKC